MVLLDGDLPVVDRPLLADVARGGRTPYVVEGERRRHPWERLGAHGVLSSSFEPDDVFDLGDGSTSAVADRPHSAVAPMVAVTGPGGTGASVAAIALAQGMAVPHARVLLADCCLQAEQAMLHNVHSAQPGLAELVDLHADRTPGLRQIRQLTAGVVERGYHLLLGLRRARHWAAIHPASLDATIDSLQAAFDFVVADVDVDVEGEADGGSIDIEERNVLARTVLARADAVLVVGQPTMKGVYSLVRSVIELLEFGVAPARVLPVVNQTADAPELRAELTRTIAHLAGRAAGGSAVGPTLFLPDVILEDRLRDRDALPETLPRLVSGAVAAMLSRTARAPGRQPPPRVAAGTLGHWAADGGGAR